ncbi:MAG: hypothetical protein JNM39_16385 [Bdellovibrionaceae bacterium]|nr:hypothetical protein [Pseudobdellovibrionaceae bacterium]
MQKRFNIVADITHIQWLNQKVSEARATDSRASYSSVIRRLIETAMDQENKVGVFKVKNGARDGRVYTTEELKKVTDELRQFRKEIPNLTEEITKRALASISEKYDIKKKRKA